MGSKRKRPTGGPFFLQNKRTEVINRLITSVPLFRDLQQLRRVEGHRFKTIRSDEEPGHEVVFLRDESGQVSHVRYHSISPPKI